MKTVVAIGGNALLGAGEKPTIVLAQKNIKKSLEVLLPLFRSKASIVLTFGNGPQVGNILLSQEKSLGKAYQVPLEVAVAQSQGEIGFLLEQELLNLFSRKKLKRSAVSLLTQVLVSQSDPGFKLPSKPVGPFYSKEKAMALKSKGFDVIEDSGRGWRRVVASPMPLEIIEQNVISKLLSPSVVVIAAGGGGIPMVKKQGALQGVPAVVDKDLASACLAIGLKADLLLILTEVDAAFLDFGKPTQRPIGKVSVKKAKEFLKEGHFGKGSMEPKIHAAILFVEKTGKKAIITSAKKLGLALKGKAGTIVSK